MKLELKKNLRVIILVSISIFVLAYIFYEARFVIYGPQLIIYSPKNNTRVTDPILQISGKAKNISMLTINGRPIMITPDNLFSDKLLLLNGYNTIEVKAKDKFDQEKSEVLQLVLTEPKQSTTTNINNQ
ncbi:MAG: hypothetical protein HY225_00230 [Candidatus Vogelbacteria bacterium]|nr:hypothetical protein [Candidatus Vogelbacteria bacterium]